MTRRKKPKGRTLQGLSLPKGCEIRETETGSKKQLAYQAFCGGEYVGQIDLDKVKRCGKTVWKVGGIFIDPDNRRRGIGTKLWEAAAKGACENGAPLASDERVSRSSKAFWNKQLDKGRAAESCSPRGKAGPVFMLSCPAPADLSGLRGLSKKRQRLADVISNITGRHLREMPRKQAHTINFDVDDMGALADDFEDLSLKDQRAVIRKAWDLANGKVS